MEDLRAPDEALVLVPTPDAIDARSTAIALGSSNGTVIE